MAEAQQRLLYNLSYYRSNYVLIFVGITAYILYAPVPNPAAPRGWPAAYSPPTLRPPFYHLA